MDSKTLQLACNAYIKMVLRTTLPRDECIDRLTIVYGEELAERAVEIVEESIEELN